MFKCTYIMHAARSFLSYNRTPYSCNPISEYLNQKVEYNKLYKSSETVYKIVFKYFIGIPLIEI